jgi:hypothetical protein
MLRQALKLESEAFIGPTLAAVGISLMLPLIVPKKRAFPIPKKTVQIIEERGCRIINKTESVFIDLVWTLIIILTALWAYSLYLSSQKPIDSSAQLPWYLIIGFFNYFTAVILSEIKEII